MRRLAEVAEKNINPRTVPKSAYIFCARGRFATIPGTMLAVLPFENANADPDSDYLSDGITETIVSNLSQVAVIRVISRNSAFRYKKKIIDAQKVGRELNVDAIVLGCIVARGVELTISAELVHTRDSSQIWGARYTHELGTFSPFRMRWRERSRRRYVFNFPERTWYV